MSHIIPYISTEPPSIHDDSFETESCKSENCDNNLSQIQIIKDEIIFAGDGTNTAIDTSETESLSPIESHKHIDSDTLAIDCVDAVIKDDDVQSDCSFEGQFDAYMDHINDVSLVSNSEQMECSDIDTFSYFIKQSDFQGVTDNNMIRDECNFGDFGAFNPILETQNGYFFEENAKSAFPTLPNSLALDMVDGMPVEDFQELNATTSPQLDRSKDVNVASCPHLDLVNSQDVEAADLADDSHEFDDDFDEFATFDNESSTTFLDDRVCQTQISTEDSVASIVESFRRTLIAAISSVDPACPSPIDDGYVPSALSYEVISSHSLINEYGARLWKELINFDYSPAFIFHWMQSTSYENFMNSMGPDYKELLSSQRATLPLYSVNLTPIEPVPMEAFNQNIHSTSSSSLDLTNHEKSGNNISEKNSDLDIKNLEEEFIFDTNLKDEGIPPSMTTDNRSSLPNLSSAVIQSEGFGSMIKSMLKPLNSGKIATLNKPMNAQTENVLKELPDLSYMTSKVLMFPVLASCELEDTI